MKRHDNNYGVYRPSQSMNGECWINGVCGLTVVSGLINGLNKNKNSVCGVTGVSKLLNRVNVVGEPDSFPVGDGA